MFLLHVTTGAAFYIWKVPILTIFTRDLTSIEGDMFVFSVRKSI